MGLLQDIRALYGGLNLVGRRAVVVGATSGIGQGIAVRLAKANVSVTVVGRSAERGNEVVAQLKALSPGADHKFVAVDAFSLKGMKSFAETWAAEHGRLDYLVLSCGIATTQGLTETPEGIDQKMCVHYYSRVAITEAFLPALRKGGETDAGGGGRVMSVLSGGVHGAYKGYKEDPELKATYSLTNAANAAGFYNDIAMDSLHRENPTIAFLHAAPGFVNTAWGREMPFYIRWAVRVVQPLGTSAEDCAEYLCSALFSPDFKGQFAPVSRHGTRTNVVKEHEEARETVWADTKKVLDRVMGTR